MTIPFGKYAGYEINDIPLEHLQWLRANVPIKARKLKQEIEWRILELEDQEWVLATYYVSDVGFGQ